MLQNKDFLTPSSFLHMLVGKPHLVHLISTLAFCNVNDNPEAYLQRPKLLIDCKKSTFLESEKFVLIKSQQKMLNAFWKNPFKSLSKFFQKLETIKSKQKLHLKITLNYLISKMILIKLKIDLKTYKKF